MDRTLAFRRDLLARLVKASAFSLPFAMLAGGACSQGSGEVLARALAEVVRPCAAALLARISDDGRRPADRS